MAQPNEIPITLKIFDKTTGKIMKISQKAGDESHRTLETMESLSPNYKAEFKWLK